MILPKRLEWMREYCEAVEFIVPKVKYVKRITSKHTSLERKQLVHGVMSYYDKKHFRISIYVSYKDRATGKITAYTTMELLATLAHELAHLNVVDHTPAHTKLECTILKEFMTKLERDGYVSMEEELKNGMYYEREEE